MTETLEAGIDWRARAEQLCGALKSLPWGHYDLGAISTIERALREAALSNPVSSRDAGGESSSLEKQYAEQAEELGKAKSEIATLQSIAKSVARAHAERVEALEREAVEAETEVECAIEVLTGERPPDDFEPVRRDGLLMEACRAARKTADYFDALRLRGTELAAAEAKAAALEKERNGLRDALNKKNVLTCVYCGHEYPPGSPTHGATVLTDHIKVCPKHPLRAAEAENRRLIEALRDALGVIEILTITAETGDLGLAARVAYRIAKSSQVEDRLRAALAADAALESPRPTSENVLDVLDAAVTELEAPQNGPQYGEIHQVIAAYGAGVLREFLDSKDGDLDRILREQAEGRSDAPSAALESPRPTPARYRGGCACRVGATAATCPWADPITRTACECKCHRPPPEQQLPEKGKEVVPSDPIGDRGSAIQGPQATLGVVSRAGAAPASRHTPATCYVLAHGGACDECARQILAEADRRRAAATFAKLTRPAPPEPDTGPDPDHGMDAAPAQLPEAPQPPEAFWLAERPGWPLYRSRDPQATCGDTASVHLALQFKTRDACEEWINGGHGGFYVARGHSVMHPEARPLHEKQQRNGSKQEVVSGVLAWTPEAGGEAEKAKAIGPLGPTGDAGEKEARCEVCGRNDESYGQHGNGQCYRLGYERLLSERKGLREALAEVKRELEESDWTCERCGQDFGMTETDIYLEVGRALAATSAPQDHPKAEGEKSVAESSPYTCMRSPDEE